MNVCLATAGLLLPLPPACTAKRQGGNIVAADISTCCRSVAPPPLLPPGHYDVQPAEDTAPLWTTPPFKPEVRFDRFWGRGVHDDKGSGVLPPLQVIAGCCYSAQVGCLWLHRLPLVRYRGLPICLPPPTTC